MCVCVYVCITLDSQILKIHGYIFELVIIIFETYWLSMCCFYKLLNLGLLGTCNFVPQFGILALTSTNKSNDMFMP